ncbi:MAG: hypothetical protein WA891_21360 [Acidobacteriaceae bacterium]
MKNAHPVVCLAFVVVVSLCAASEPNAIRNKLASNTTIQGIPCAKGDAWFYPDGSLNQCTLSALTTIGGYSIPRGALIELWPTGAARHLTLPHDAVLSGYRIKGGALPRSSSEENVTAFYPSGRLRSVVLAGDQTIQGVPCGAGPSILFYDSIDGSNHVDFYEDGKLQSCNLTRDFGGQRIGQRLVLPDEPKSLIPAAATAASR